MLDVDTGIKFNAEQNLRRLLETREYYKRSFEQDNMKIAIKF